VVVGMKRMQKGSTGRVYPLPFTDRIATEAVEHSWQAWHLENEFIRLMVLPEISGTRDPQALALRTTQ